MMEAAPSLGMMACGHSVRVTNSHRVAFVPEMAGSALRAEA